ncbi:MAG TPA: helix-hairpin-helix domain-containing protein [Candidatus Krumholzibacteria bacterium]|nr:helix-hairpin-helix domain-containing protein [Candidatus Krumholzibacteria bacterium]
MRRVLGAGILLIVLGGGHLVAFIDGRGGSPPPVVFVSPPAWSVARVPPPPRDPPLAAFRSAPFAFLSRAPVDSLVMLPGIGPVLAARIVADRAARGPFTTWSEVDRVRGIGPAAIRRLSQAAGRS